jgi:phosphoribosylaminoimidazole-succinocarboxamide synthase
MLPCGKFALDPVLDPVYVCRTGQVWKSLKKEKQVMKVEHLFQVMVAEIAFHEILINALTAYIAKQSNASIDEVDAFIEQHSSDKRTAYVQSVHMRLKKRIEELAAAS